MGFSPDGHPARCQPPPTWLNFREQQSQRKLWSQVVIILKLSPHAMPVEVGEVQIADHFPSLTSTGFSLNGQPSRY